MGYERDMDWIVRLGNEHRNQVIQELIEAAEALDVYRVCPETGHMDREMPLADWLKSQMEGE